MKAFFRDLVRSVLIGLIIAAVLSVALFSAGFLLRQFQLREGLVFVRGGLLITGALGLLICAGLLIWPQRGVKLQEDPWWKQRFKLFGLLLVVGTISVVLLVLASLADYLLYFSVWSGAKSA